VHGGVVHEHEVLELAQALLLLCGVGLPARDALVEVPERPESPPQRRQVRSQCVIPRLVARCIPVLCAHSATLPCRRFPKQMAPGHDGGRPA
jgi:hypothetical protein